MIQLYPYPKQKSLPTMYDLPSEDPEEPGLPDEFHDYQPDLLTQTCQSPHYSEEDYFIASDLNLYYDSQHTLWYKRPDWFVVLGAKRSHNQQELRLSYVIWQEQISPFLVIELASPGTEDEDLGRTERKEKKPPTKWEVYEKILQVPYYVIYDRYQNQLRVFVLNSGRYERLELSEEKVWLEPLGLGLGLWQGVYEGVEGRWLRFYDRDGAWIPTPSERAEQERQRAEQAESECDRQQQRADQAELELQKLREKLQQLNVDPDSLS
ncbi:Uma2 family endonuclease [Roseofilum sp. BLCC_M91]|uniref:Uma2 family endonuclease n=1 Tax=Roseofilum halophilum BLCC-M91 TaxID=3022259 RepID=A0ABT7BPE7_9CYAN|nr:Uma2 family endonuclease [Roseofilum halophilum]MDJ1181062.1 Uma2 family endonuclease [Roseofilum halophilum BLCC-M91]